MIMSIPEQMALSRETLKWLNIQLEESLVRVKLIQSEMIKDPESDSSDEEVAFENRHHSELEKRIQFEIRNMKRLGVIK